MLDLLLEFGADINSQNEFGDSALHISSANGKLHVVRHLVESGAKLSLQNSRKECPMVVAALFGQLDVLAYFLEMQSWDDISVACVSKHEAIVQCLVNACGCGCISTVRLILQKCPFINISEMFGGATPLIAACTNGQIEVIKLLLKRGVNGI